jgi:hypothetical protein
MTERRTFFVALGVPRGADDGEAVRLAYRNVVHRYRQVSEESSEANQAIDPCLQLMVLRSYSERRHGLLFDVPLSEGAGQSEVDRFYDGQVPEVMLPVKARTEGKDLYVELRLSPTQARSGGLFQVHIPVIKKCPSCGSLQDEQAQRSCASCKGAGRLTEDRIVEVTVPPGVQDQQTARLAMEDIGLAHTDLIVHLMIR